MLTFFKNYHNTKYQTNNSYKQISIINFFANPLFHKGSTEFFYAYADDYHYSLVNEFLNTQNNYKEELTKIEEILLNNQINVNDTWYIDIINYEQKRSIQGNLDVSKIFINYKEEFVPSSALDFTFEVKNVLHAYEYCYVRALLINTKLTGSFMNYFVAVAKLANNTSLLMGNSLILVAALPKKEITVGAAPRINPENPSPLFFQANHYVFEHKNMFSTFSHPFHIVDPSPWPFCTSMGLWYLTITTVAFFHNFLSSIFNIVFGIFYLCICLGFWWRDVIRESTYEFKHTPYVRRGLLTGMLLFIISEIMFFFGFFWAFFHVSLAPSFAIGAVWPPAIISVISPWQLPLVNTLCLLLSGVSLTIAHRQLNKIPYISNTESFQWFTYSRILNWMCITVFLGVFFLGCQACEYYLSPFTFQDTVFGGTFYILTGLHGLHVIVGTIFLIVCLWRASRLQFTVWKQVGFKSAVWYWHFVDVVWIFLFIVIYVWGGLA